MISLETQSIYITYIVDKYLIMIIRKEIRSKINSKKESHIIISSGNSFIDPYIIYRFLK